MAKIAKNLTELIGRTPLMELAEYSRKYGLKQNIIAKLEAVSYTHLLITPMVLRQVGE